MSVATFDNTMADIILELSDREIYTDIRSETNDTAGFDEAYDVAEVGPDWCVYPQVLSPGATVRITVTAQSGHTEITWFGVTSLWAGGWPPSDTTESQCIEWGGEWIPANPPYTEAYCLIGDMSHRIRITPYSSTSNSYTFEVMNTHPDLPIRYGLRVSYRYLAIRRIQVRAIDDEATAKYGRRVMNLLWPLGQTITQMQSFVDSYLDRYKEPVLTATMRVQGRTDALIEQILTRHISDKITVNNAELGMAQDFFINAVTITRNVFDVLEATWELEAVRSEEEYSLFTLDVSELDGPDVLGS